MKRLCLSLMFVLLLFSTRSHATTITPFTFDQLCEKADAVVHAQCLGSRAAWDSTRGMIYTETTLRVLDPVSGSAGAQEIVLRLPGGTVNDTTLTIPDFPAFRNNDEMVIFLTGRDGSGHPWPVGMGQGIYPVFRDAAGLAKVAVQPGVNPSPLAKPTVSRATAPETIPVHAFIQIIQKRLKQPAPPAAGPGGEK